MNKLTSKPAKRNLALNTLTPRVSASLFGCCKPLVTVCMDVFLAMRQRKASGLML